MLKFLSVENFALIDRLEIEFQAGLSLITGETGSGKSILVDAVGLLVGQRASQEMVRQGFDKARVEGIFDLPADHPAWALLRNAGLDGDRELIIRREIAQNGGHKVFVNGALTTQGFLAELGSLLADIHGQHDQQLLLQPRTHLDFLDAFGANQAALATIAARFAAWQDLKSRVARLVAGEQERLQKIDTLKYQVGDIEKLGLTPGLDQDLEREKALLLTAERRLQSATQAYQLLYEQEESALSRIDNAEKSLASLVELDPGLAGGPDRLHEARFALEEIAFQLRDYAAKIESDPTRLEQIEERLAEIQKARRKYGESVDQILAFCESARKQLEELLQSGQQTEELSQARDEAERAYLETARALSAKRRHDSEALRRAVEKELEYLSMQNTVFEINIQSEAQATDRGIDEVEFFISPNVGEAPRPLAKIASGGELSRVILALKSVLTLEGYPKTLVFDEIDAGIGGRAASNVGEKLAALARDHQVFCVTHLPQIALHADHHYLLDKRERRNRTIIEISRLEKEARVEELARMLAGEAMTKGTLEHARELLGAKARRSAK
jgi:DNA repair protein RecN (Recombination protein N)